MSEIDDIFGEVLDDDETVEKPTEEEQESPQEEGTSTQEESDEEGMDAFFDEDNESEEEEQEEEPKQEKESPKEKDDDIDDFFDGEDNDNDAGESNLSFGSKKGSAEPEQEQEQVLVETSPYDEKEFDYSPEEPSLQQTFMIHGLKGDGKSGLALSFPGDISVLSFDRKTSKVWLKMYDKDERITVYDGIRYLRKDSAEAWLESAVKSFYYVMGLLDHIREEKPDWIVIDGTEILIGEICEFAMRHRQRLSAFGGVKWTKWRERNMYVDAIYAKALSIAKHGVVYTAYVTDKTYTIENGAIVEKKREPKWAANMKTQVDTVIHIESRQSDKGREYWATVESSKTPEIDTGLKVDVTNAGIKKIINASEQEE